MGVYIEGLDMPTSCGECHDSGLWSGISYLCKGGCFDDYSACCAIGQAGCPLVEVKIPHGGLIDRDEVIEEMCIKYTKAERQKKLMYASVEVKQGFCDLLTGAPTVIEAEDER